MGFFDRQKEKTQRWIREGYEGRLEPGEEVIAAFTAITRIPWWPYFLLLPLFFYFEFERGISPPAWVIGAAVGGLIMIFLRNHYVVLTDRRVLVLHLAWMSQRRVGGETAVPRSQASASFAQKMINARFRLQTGATKHDLVVARNYWPEAETLVRELAGSPQPASG